MRYAGSPRYSAWDPSGLSGAGPDHARQRLPSFRVLLPDRLGRDPGRADRLAHDAGLSEGRLPPDPSDADGPRVHDRLALRVVVDAHLGDVDHEAGARRGGEDEPRGEPDRGPVPGEPHVDSGVGELHLRDAHPETARDVEQGVVVRGGERLRAADEGVVGIEPPHPGGGENGRNRRRDGGRRNGAEEARCDPPHRSLRGPPARLGVLLIRVHVQRIATCRPLRPRSAP